MRDTAVQNEDNTIHAKINSKDVRFFFSKIFRRFEFDFCLCEFFSDDSNFWRVWFSITSNVTVHVHVLWLVCTHTIPFRMLLCP